VQRGREIHFGFRAEIAGEVRLAASTYAQLGPHKAVLLRGWLSQQQGDAFAN